MNKNGGWIFIFHSHLDIDIVRRIRNKLEDRGFEPLMFFLKCIPFATADAGNGLSHHARQTLFGGSRTGGFCGLKGTQNEVFSMSKIRLFVRSWHRKSCSEAERFSVPTGEQEVYKTRRSVRLSHQ
mgnify:CR=1 FL=1